MRGGQDVRQLIGLEPSAAVAQAHPHHSPARQVKPPAAAATLAAPADLLDVDLKPVAVSVDGQRAGPARDLNAQGLGCRDIDGYGVLTTRHHLASPATGEATARRDVVKGSDVSRPVALVTGYEVGGGGVRVRHHVIKIYPAFPQVNA